MDDILRMRTLTGQFPHTIGLLTFIVSIHNESKFVTFEAYDVEQNDVSQQFNASN